MSLTRGAMSLKRLRTTVLTSLAPAKNTLKKLVALELFCNHEGPGTIQEARTFDGNVFCWTNCIVVRDINKFSGITLPFLRTPQVQCYLKTCLCPS